MMKRMFEKCCAIFVFVGLCAVVAQPARAAQPAAVVELESISALISRAGVLSKALGQPQLPPEALTGMLGGVLKAPGLVGIDTAKPVQVYIFLPELGNGATPSDPAAMQPQIAFALPLQGDGKAYSAAVRGMFPDVEAAGSVEHLTNAEMPGQELYVATVGGRAAVGADLETVEDLRKLLVSQPASKAVIGFPGTVRVRLDMAVCVPFVEAAKGLAGGMLRGQEMPPEVKMDPAAIAEAQLDGWLMLLRELRSYTLGIQITPSAITIYERITPMVGTKTATWIAGMGKPASTYMECLPENAMFASVGSGMNVMDQMAKPCAEIMGKIYGGMGPPMDQMGPVMSEMMTRCVGLFSGDIAMGIVPATSGKGVGFVEVVALADSVKAKKVYADLFASFNDDWGKAMPGVSMVMLPVRNYQGVDIQTFSYKIEAATNQTAMAMPAMSMEWMEGLRYEMAFVEDHLVYTCGAPEIMDAALNRLKEGGTPVDKSAAFTELFPAAKGNIVEVHTLSLCGIVKGLLGVIPGIPESVLAAIPDRTGGVAGYSISRGSNLISFDRISFDEIKAIQEAVPAMAGALPGLMEQFGLPGMP